MNSCSVLYTLSAWFLGVCYGFVLLSSAAGQFSEINIFENGESLRYTLQSKVLLNERDTVAKNVGFYIDGEVTISVVWGEGYQKLLKIELMSPQLHIRSRKTSSPDGFIPHSSKLNQVQNKPFLAVWNNGRIEKILLAKGETTSMNNLKKGVASLLQFQIIDGEARETDASGPCTVKYSSSSPINFLKTKTGCEPQDFHYSKNTNDILGIEVVTSRQTEYELDSSNTHLKSIISKENHLVHLLAKAELGNYVESEQILSILERKIITPMESDDIDQAIDEIGRKEGLTFTQETLLTENEAVSSDDLISFTKQVENQRNHLKPENIGTLRSAKVFIELINSARNAPKDVISKVLSSKKNKQILHQLYDILGCVQTPESHAAVMKTLHFDKEELIDLSERYLWSLSFSAQPNPEIIRDLLKKFMTVVSIPEKVKETMILTMASMTNKLKKSRGTDSNIKIARDIEENILNNLEYAKGEEKDMYFRALKNLKSQNTIPILLNYVKTGTLREGVLAWKALRYFDAKFWNDDVLTAARKSFFQLDRKYDTSSRTLAADILLETKPDDKLLNDLLEYLISNDPTYEVKQYVFQKIKMLADTDHDLKQRVQRLIKNNRYLDNYHGLSPRGLSTLLSRRFWTSPSSNGSLVSVQEIKSGIVKRGLIDVVIEKDGVHSELFSLGIFSGGLSSFITSDNADEETEEESATAGIELTVMDTQIRPFVFFNGQGELMGHVWSGTASEKTPAFQVLALLHDHLEYIRLGSGFIARTDIKSATSFDLSGKIEISLWNRYAEGQVQKSAGIFISGSTSIDTMFVESKVEFTTSVEPKLDLQTDIEFVSNVQLCMRLVQPETLFRHNIHKIERIPGSKHRMRISRYKRHSTPGLTYSINKKNNEMCNAIFR